MTIEPKHRAEFTLDTDEVFFIPDRAPYDREHYEQDTEWPDEDEYRE